MKWFITFNIEFYEFIKQTASCDCKEQPHSKVYKSKEEINLIDHNQNENKTKYLYEEKKQFLC